MQATEKKLGNNKVWMTVLSVGVVIAIILGIVALVNHGDTKANAIPTISQQVENIENSIPELEAVSTELKVYIDTLEASVEKLESDLTATNTAIDTVKAELKSADDASEKKVLDEMNALKTSTETQISTLKSDIATLKTKDTELDKKITDLKAYVDGEIKATEDWANATFATLTQYSEIQTTIAGIKADIEDINTKIAAVEKDVSGKVAAINKSIADLDEELAKKVTEITNGYISAIATAKSEIEAAYTAAIEKAIADSETSMKDWVNETLADGYYDIADIDAKLTALETKLTDADTDLKKQIEDQQTALEQAKKDLAAAYEKAISDAIETNNGVIDGKIADAVKSAKAELQSQIGTIYDEIEKIKTRLDTLETNFANRIQSITFVPNYSDGEVTMDYTTRKVAVHFRISPAAIASLIKADNVKAFIRYTDDPTTGGGFDSDLNNDEFSLAVTSVSGGADGIITVALEESSENPLSTDFWQGDVEAIIYIQITDENGNNVVSEVIPMRAHGYVATTFSINPFHNGAVESGQVTE